MKKMTAIGLGTIMTILSLAGCGNSSSSSSSESPSSTASNQPVTLKVGVPPFSNPEFDSIFVKAAADKFPYITLEKIPLPSSDYSTQLSSKGIKPDIIIGGLSTNYSVALKDSGFALDMTSLAKQYKMDLSQFDKVRLNTAQIGDNNPDLTIIPYSLDTAALYYNKDIFDKFGIAYPKDFMTWDQIIDLAKRLTRTVDGVSYRGFEPDMIDRAAGQMGLQAVDPATNKASVNNDQWKSLLERYKLIYGIQGNEAFQWGSLARNEFSKAKDLAMFAGLGPDGFDKAEGLNWDLATYPVVDSNSKTTQALGGRGFSVTATSDHKNEAFQLVNYWVSDDVQKTLSANGIAPALNKSDIQKVFASALPGFKGKHMDALFMLQPADVPVSSIYLPDGANVFRTDVQNMLKTNGDINTTLRTAEEDMNQKIATKMAK